MRQARGDLAAARRQLQSRILPMLGVLRTLEDRARQALTAEREDVARLALERRWSLAQELRALEEQAQELGREEEQLGLVEERLVEAGSLETLGLGGGDLLQREIAALDRTRTIEEQLAMLRRETRPDDVP